MSDSPTDPPPPTEAPDAADALARGAALQAEGRHAGAVELFLTAQKQTPREPLPFLLDAISRLAMGDARAALKAASEACWRAPDMAQPHYAYGQAFDALGLPDRAAQAFARAVQLDANWADAWVNLGVACYRQRRLGDAITAMRRALEVHPGHAAAAANLGAFLRLAGGYEEAERLLRSTLAGNPEAVGARLNLVADLLQEERGEEALALLEAAPTPADRVAARAWRLQHSLALLQLNRVAQARASLDALEALGPVPAALAPLWRWRLVLLALADRDVTKACSEAEAMEASLSLIGPNAVPDHEIMAHYDLAKFWAQQGATARAMRHWTAGHGLLARFQPFSRQSHRAFVDASIAEFGAARLRDGARANNDDPAPVFVVGMPRSGTTLVEQILAAHRDAHGAGERTALGHGFATLSGGGDDAQNVRKVAALGADELSCAAQAYLVELHKLAPDRRRIVDKTPGNFLYLGLAALMFPKAKFVHCQRDPRDIGLSIFTFRFHGAHGYAHDLGDLGWYIGEHDRLMSHWRVCLPNRILSLRLSDWVEDFDATLARLLAHLELPHDEGCKRFYERRSRVRTVSRAQVRQPINARGLGRWRAFEGELAPLIEALEMAGSLGPWR